MTESQAMFPDGAAYERLMGRWSRLTGQKFLDWLDLPSDLDWLDVGCGNGAFTDVIGQRSACRSLTGLDPSEAQIAYAQSRQGGCTGARFLIGDAQNLPFADASFDAAVMGLVIAFLPDPARGLAELARVTRPGGTVATYMWDLPAGGLPLAPLFRSLAAIGHPGTLPPSAAMSTPETLGALWAAGGLKDVQVETIRIAVSFSDFEDFWHSQTLPSGPQTATLRNLSPAETEALRDHLRASLPTDAAGRITYDGVATAVTGRRA
jgi:SAM-dependent methyltransferase